MTLRLLILAGSLLVISSAGFADPDEFVVPPLGPRDIYFESAAAGGDAEVPSLHPDSEVALRAIAAPAMQANFAGHTAPPDVPRTPTRHGLFASTETDGMLAAIGVSSTTAILLGLIPIVMLVVALWGMGIAARAAEDRQAAEAAEG